MLQYGMVWYGIPTIALLRCSFSTEVFSLKTKTLALKAL